MLCHIFSNFNANKKNEGVLTVCIHKVNFHQYQSILIGKLITVTKQISLMNKKRVGKMNSLFV